MVRTNMDRKNPGKLTDLVKRAFCLVLVLILLAEPCVGNPFKSKSEPAPVPVGTEEEPAVNCDELEANYDRRGFVTVEERNNYCYGGCDFLDVECKSHADDFFDYAHTIFELFQMTVDIFLNGTDTEWIDNMFEPEEIDSSMISVWTDIAWRLSWLLGSLFPIILNQYKYYNLFVAVAMIFVFMFIHLVTPSPLAITLHNIVVSVVCIFAPANGSFVTETLVGLPAILGVSIVIFILDPVTQVLVMVGMISLFMAFLFWAFWKKRGTNNTSTIIIIVQIVVLLENLTYIKKNMALDSIGGALLEMLLNSIVPCGAKKNAVSNIVWLARIFAIHAKKYHLNMFWTFFGACVFQIACSIAVKASLGAYYIYELRYKFGIESLGYGMLVYMIDFFGPAEYAFRLLFKMERGNWRRGMYSFIGLMMQVAEYYYAYDVFKWRLLFSLIDKALLRSHYGRLPHYLGFNLNFHGAAFPQEASLSWHSLSEVWSLGKGLVEVHVRKGNKVVKGLGCVISGSGKRALYTIKHVIKNADEMVVRGRSYGKLDWNEFESDEGDNVVSARLENEDGPCGSVDMLTLLEVDDIESLVFVNLDEDGEVMVNNVSNFRFHRGVLHAHVNLKKGDSGGPVFGILRNGPVRYVGAVSKGSFDEGSGNIISTVVGVSEADSSDDEGLALGDVRRFNIVRRKVADKEVVPRYNQFNHSLRQYSNELKDFSHWNIKPSVQEVESMSDEDAIEHFIKKGLQIGDVMREDRDEDGGGDDGDGEHGVGHNKHKNQDRKRRNKDKAYRKRQFMILKVLLSQMRTCYVSDDIDRIFYQIVHGNVPDSAGDDEKVIATGGGGWMMAAPMNEMDAWHADSID